jgi:hypothetical protein
MNNHAVLSMKKISPILMSMACVRRENKSSCDAITEIRTFHQNYEQLPLVDCFTEARTEKAEYCRILARPNSAAILRVNGDQTALTIGAKIFFGAKKNTISVLVHVRGEKRQMTAEAEGCMRRRW